MMSFNGARPKDKNHSTCKKDGNLENQKLKTKRKTEEDSCRLYRHLSVRLYDVLDHIGASAEFRQLRQDHYISHEIIFSPIFIKQNERVKKRLYIFGSSIEGTTIPSLNSDLDMLGCLYVPVVENTSEAGYGHSLLLIRDIHTQPGYVKLQRVCNRQPQTVYTQDVDKANDECDSEGRICIKHVSNIGHYAFNGERNGPADTDIDNNIDKVQGFRCSKIPGFIASEWIVRNRRYKWQPKHILDKMTKMGCFFVGVGHPASRDRAIEWRVSFSLQERALMLSMNMVQHKCYVLLKIIKNDLIEPVVGKSISSYHLKTCMFHTIENTRLSFWKRENLCHCVLLCLYVILKWVYLGFCPNYFITEENMFDRDMHRRQRLNLLHRLRFILSHGCGFLFLIKIDNIGFLLKNGLSNVQTDSNVDIARFKQKFLLINDRMIFRRQLCVQATKHDNARAYIKMIFKYVSETESIKDHTKQQTLKAFSYILPFIQLQLAQSYASLSYNTRNGEDKGKLQQKCGYHLWEARHCDLTSSELLQATSCVKDERYETCIGILDKLEQTCKLGSLSTCSNCNIYIQPSSICTCFDQPVDFPIKIEQKQLNASEILSRTLTCMTFLRSDISITPEGLKFELFRSINMPTVHANQTCRDWKDLAMVDAVVYIHFMQYLVNTKLNRRVQQNLAKHKLKVVLKADRKLGHREVGYNLLGWIHLHEKLIPRAIKYFKKSWAIRPDYNAAKLHMLILIRDINS